MRQDDSKSKIYFLMVIAAYLDFIEFIMSVTYLPEYEYTSTSLEMRLSGVITISSALIYYGLLKFPIFKHQLVSLVIIGICIILLIISEIIFQGVYSFIPNIDFFFVMLFIILIHFFNSLMDSLEKYLFEFDNINPFEILMYEGLFGLIIILIYSFLDSPFNDFDVIYKNCTAGQFALFIFLLFLYIILSCLRNGFRVITNKIFTPITKSLTDYVLNPIYLIVYFVIGNDFVIKGKRNYLYFFINLFLSLTITLTGFVYNEFVVLFFCGLERETHDQISKRADSKIEDKIEMNVIYSDDYEINGTDDDDSFILVEKKK